MKRNIIKTAGVAILATVLLTGCQTMGQKEGFGMVTGAALGGLAGNHIGGGTGRTIATVVGVFVGGMFGREIGAQLDQNDRYMMHRNFNHTMEHGRSGETSGWRNPDSGNYGSITPTRTRYVPSEQRYCREYQTTVTVAGGRQHAYGTACRMPDGSWEMQ